MSRSALRSWVSAGPDVVGVDSVAFDWVGVAVGAGGVRLGWFVELYRIVLRIGDCI